MLNDCDGKQKNSRANLGGRGGGGAGWGGGTAFSYFFAPLKSANSEVEFHTISASEGYI